MIDVVGVCISLPILLNVTRIYNSGAANTKKAVTYQPMEFPFYIHLVNSFLQANFSILLLPFRQAYVEFSVTIFHTLWLML